MVKNIVLLLAAATAGLAQTTVYLPAVGARSCTVTAASSATPSQITCNSHGFSAGNVIVITNDNGTQKAGFIVNGLRKVVAVVDSNNFTISDINNTNIAGPASWACATNVSPGSLVHPTGCRAVQMTAYTTRAHPRTFGFDGPTGALSLSLQDASGTGKANSSNFVYSKLTTQVTNWTSSATPIAAAAAGGDTGEIEAQAALSYWATGDSAARTKALNAINLFDINVPWGSTACY